MGKTEREREDFLFSHCNLDDLLFGDGRELPGMAVWLFFIYMSHCDRHVLNVNIFSHTSFQHFPILTLKTKDVFLQALSEGCALCLIVLSIFLKTLNAQDVVSVVSGCSINNWVAGWCCEVAWEHGSCCASLLNNHCCRSQNVLTQAEMFPDVLTLCYMTTILKFERREG